MCETSFTVDEMMTNLQLAICCSKHFDVDVAFYSKAMLTSSVNNHTLEDQIQWAYHLDKLNLLQQCLPKYS